MRFNSDVLVDHRRVRELDPADRAGDRGVAVMAYPGGWKVTAASWLMYAWALLTLAVLYGIAAANI